MTLKTILIAALGMATGNPIFVQRQSQPKTKPKTTDDYEAMHKAEMKRRRKAEKAAINSNTI